LYGGPHHSIMEVKEEEDGEGVNTNSHPSVDKEKAI